MPGSIPGAIKNFWSMSIFCQFFFHLLLSNWDREVKKEEKKPTVQYTQSNQWPSPRYYQHRPLAPLSIRLFIYQEVQSLQKGYWSSRIDFPLPSHRMKWTVHGNLPCPLEDWYQPLVVLKRKWVLIGLAGLVSLFPMTIIDSLPSFKLSSSLFLPSFHSPYTFRSWLFKWWTSFDQNETRKWAFLSPRLYERWNSRYALQWFFK